MLLVAFTKQMVRIPGRPGPQQRENFLAPPGSSARFGSFAKVARYGYYVRSAPVNGTSAGLDWELTTAVRLPNVRAISRDHQAHTVIWVTSGNSALGVEFIATCRRKRTHAAKEASEPRIASLR